MSPAIIRPAVAPASSSRGGARRPIPVAAAFAAAASFVVAVAAAIVAGGAAVAAEASPEPRFDVLEFVVLGNTRLDVETVERAVMPFMGPQRGMAEVESARGALERAYQQRGYLSVGVDIPEQRVDGGVVTLQVVEGRVGRLRVRGARYQSPGTITAALPAAAEGTVPQFAELEQQLGAVNRAAGLATTPSLKPGRTPGTLDIEIAVEDKPPTTWSFELNNQRAVNTEPWRIGVGVRHADLWGRRHAGSLGLLATPADPSQVRVFTASYAWPTGGPDDPTLSLYAVRSDSNTPAAIGATTVFGGQTVLGLRWVVPLPQRFGLYHTLSAGLDAKRLVQQDFPTLEYAPLSLSYGGVLPGERENWQLDMSLNVSVRGLANDDEAFRARRFLGSASYAYLRWDLAHERRVGDGWQVRARLSGQHAQQPLVPAEQFALGGAGSVRGHLESSSFGDRGLLASIELRSMPRALAAAGAWTWQWAVFYDQGRTGIVDPLPEQRAGQTLSGVGLGLRIRQGRAWSATLDVARPLKVLPEQPDDWRAHLRIALEL